MAGPVDNTQDVLDSRDIIDRIVELQTAKDNAAELGEEFDDDDNTELDVLNALAAEASDYAADWEHGETLIRDSYFERYAQELADDIGALKPTQWPYTCIDWANAALELQQDYTSVDFDGVTYWVR